VVDKTLVVKHIFVVKTPHVNFLINQRSLGRASLFWVSSCPSLLALERHSSYFRMPDAMCLSQLQLVGFGWYGEESQKGE
jgi:hypothetical protein